MSSIQMNETQIVHAAIKCLETAEDECVDLSFEDCIEFIGTAMRIDYHSDELDEYIKEFVKNKEDN